jgi:alkanesulfonate monooxygenase SsuD/methylene tetrahydromethanopterin reductase-like flavin-dependent oxidoreductase (luciferase family)
MGQVNMRHGIFLAPFHPVDTDPTLALQRDLELVEWLDVLGYEEAWIGEHHSRSSRRPNCSSPPPPSGQSASGLAPA